MSTSQINGTYRLCDNTLKIVAAKAAVEGTTKGVALDLIAQEWSELISKSNIDYCIGLNPLDAIESKLHEIEKLINGVITGLERESS